MPPSEPDLTAWVDGVRAAHPRFLAKALTAVENRLPLSLPLLEALFPFTSHGLLIGITGPPGAGKSTLVDQLAHEYRRRGLRVAILAIDPSSPFTGGALLGDRIRMQRHATDPHVFIRSMASRGNLGGLAASTTEAALLLSAAGFDRILIETVGVGQEEVDVAQLADVSALLLVPGLGDEIQALKAGILEAAAILVVNKADRPGAAELLEQLRAALSLSASPESPPAPIFSTIATTGSGVPSLASALESPPSSPAASRRAELLWFSRLRLMLRDRLLERLPLLDIQRAAAEVALRRRNPFTYLTAWLARY